MMLKATNLLDPTVYILIILKELFISLRTLAHKPYALNLKKWRISESNRWPSACKADALANWANPPGSFEMTVDGWRMTVKPLFCQLSTVN